MIERRIVRWRRWTGHNAPRGKHPGKVSGAWVLKGTRMPVSVIFENLKAGTNIDEIMECFEGLGREQVEAVIEFAARSLGVTPSSPVTC